MMKRLIDRRASRIINATVLEFYGVEVNATIDLAALDIKTVSTIKQMMTCVLHNRHTDAEAWVIELLANCVIRYVMHVEPDITQEIAPQEPNLMIWGYVIAGIREYTTQKYADCTAYEAIYPIIVTEILMHMEKLFFRHIRLN